MRGLHPGADAGFAAGADLYVSGRPGYPPDIDRWLRDDLRVKACKTVVDLGAGTGIFTQTLAETGAAVIAVEPVAQMRARLRQDLPNVRVCEGRAEALGLADRSVDALVCAQSFHWFATPAALAEMRRVLKIGGRLGLVWNVRDLTAPWVAALDALISAYEGDVPRYHGGRWRQAFPAPGFSPLTETAFNHAHEGPPEKVVIDRLLSTSFIAALDDAERERVADLARAILAKHKIVGLRVAFPYRTLAYACERIS
jgi:SAM-dependent methyltransferase